MQGFAVLGAELEDVADFDAALDLKGLAAFGAGVASHGVAQVGPFDGQFHVADEAEVADVLVGLVGTGDPVVTGLEFLVGVDLFHALEAGRAGKAHGRTGHGFHLFGRGELDVVGVEEVGQLDFVEFTVAAQEHGHGLAVSHEEQGLDELVAGGVHEGAEFFDGVLVGGVQLFHGRAGGGVLFELGLDGGAFHVGGPGAFRPVGAGGDGVFAGFGKHHEFVGEVAADSAGIGFHGAEVEAHAGEDLVIGLLHGGVALVRAFVVHIEGVGVLHQEFTAAHEAEAGAHFVAVLGLDLVQVQGKLAIGLHFAAQEVGHHFFVGRAEAVVAVVAVLEAQEFLAVLLPAAGLFPEFAGLDHRQEGFKGTGFVHFAAHDGLGLFKGTKAQRQPGVDAGSELADHARAHQQLVADHFGVGRGFFEGGDVVTAPAHGKSSSYYG